ncbi:hypothetical protein DFH08DRAFT_882263 [Mycena albidolilacea]|uniref:Uncharacterized protein n=1 Tax=Mycena albidolilacea TaxID=1033008 RepID=A0AAD7EL13_9AGAR|nr:hypothetical protein DFH08DRAFT_882263 [Mycena albidolilacea]
MGRSNDAISLFFFFFVGGGCAFLLRLYVPDSELVVVGQNVRPGSLEFELQGATSCGSNSNNTDVDDSMKRSPVVLVRIPNLQSVRQADISKWGLRSIWG